MKLAILTPIYNDWTALTALIGALDAALALERLRASILIVDDGSRNQPEITLESDALTAISEIEVLHLRRNLGHQRAIAIGLAYLEANTDYEGIIVMDGDGEDRPEDISRLFRRWEQENRSAVVFAERTRRSEGITFAALYRLYRGVHWVLTGERVRVGNFSIISRASLRRLVAVSDLWNHYAAAVFHARIPFVTVPTTRGTRYAGESQMKFVSLVVHGLSAMSVFGDRIGVRLLLATCALTSIIALVSIAFVGWHVGTHQPFPGWTLYAAAAMVLLVFLVFATSLAFVFIILAGRNSSGFLPFREYAHYVSHTTSIPLDRLNV